MSNEQKQERKPSAEADGIRARGCEALNEVQAKFEKATQIVDIAKFFVGVVYVGVSYLVEIAAQLAEINSRDTAAEIRAREAEAFVLGMQQELQRLQGSGIVIPGFDFSAGKKGG